jgi:hypothetical protein
MRAGGSDYRQRKAAEGLLTMQYPACHKGENGILQGVVTAIISMLRNVVMVDADTLCAGEKAPDS